MDLRERRMPCVLCSHSATCAAEVQRPACSPACNCRCTRAVAIGLARPGAVSRASKALATHYDATAKLMEAEAAVAARRAGSEHQAAAQRQVNENFQRRKAAEAEAQRQVNDNYATAQAAERARVGRQIAEHKAALTLRETQAKSDRLTHSQTQQKMAEAKEAAAGGARGICHGEDSDPGATGHPCRARGPAAGRGGAASGGHAPPLLPPLDPAKKPAGPRQYSRGWGAFLPTNLLQNAGSFAGCTAASTVIIGAMGAAAYSVNKLIETGQQTARLSQVSRGVGGSAKDLTNDVQQLAAANGRSTDEAMESAIAWSRLGLNRVQVNVPLGSEGPVRRARRHQGKAARQRPPPPLASKFCILDS